MKTNHKYLLVVQTILLPLSVLFAEEPLKDSLIEKLSEAYTTNNALIHQTASPSAEHSLDLLTENFREHLQFIKTLSNDKLKRSLKNQSFEYITASTVLKNHILNLYDEAKPVSKNSHLIEIAYASEPKSPKEITWEEAHGLILKVVNTYNRLGEHPELIQTLERLLNKETCYQWHTKSLLNQKEIFPASKQLTLKRIDPIPSQNDTSRIYYIWGILGKSSYLARYTIEKKSHGFWISEITETTDPKTILRLEQLNTRRRNENQKNKRT